MAYNEKHLAKLADLKALGTKQKEVADALAARVDTWRMLALRPTSLRVSR